MARKGGALQFGDAGESSPLRHRVRRVPFKRQPQKSFSPLDISETVIDTGAGRKVGVMKLFLKIFAVSAALTLSVLLVGCGESNTAQSGFINDNSSDYNPGEYNAPAPAVGGDLDCSNMNGPVAVGASDPHGLDADNDGIGCE